MINRFETARFIDRYSTKIMIGLGVVIVVLAGLVFYIYGLGSVNNFQNSANPNSTVLDQAKITSTLNDIDARGIEWEHIKNANQPSIDIFKQE